MRTWLFNGGFEDEEVDPDYVPEHRDSDDRLEYRFETEALQEFQDDDPEVIAESEDCPTTPNCEKAEHRIVKDLAMVETSEESEESNELNLEIKELREGRFNILACEKPKHQETLVEVEVGDIGLEEDAELEGFPVRVIIDIKSDDVHSTTAVLDKKLRGDIGIIKLMLNEEDVISLYIVREGE